jgi:uncharacterized protein (TIGR02145 family)
MVQNLKTTRFNDGTSIPIETGGEVWYLLATPAYCWYGNDPGNATYGALYNWFAVSSVAPKTLAPKGWHVPTTADWNMLASNLGGADIAAGGLMKAVSNLWTQPNANASNAIGFTALPGGFRSSMQGTFMQIHDVAQWWSSTSAGSGTADFFSIRYDAYSLISYGDPMVTGRSVRLIKD